MIKLCETIKTKLKPAQVNHLYELLMCHRRRTPAYLSQQSKKVIEVNGGSLVWVHGIAKTPMAVTSGYRNTEFDQYHSVFDWENEFIVPIASLTFDPENGGCNAHDEDGVFVNHFPLSGVQQLFEADPTRFT